MKNAILRVLRKFNRGGNHAEMEPGPYTDNQIAKIKVTKTGNLYLNKELVTFEKLSEKLSRIRDANGIVWYYRENGYEDPAPEILPLTEAIVDRIAELRLPVEIHQFDFE